MDFERIVEYLISPAKQQAIQQLLQQCFTDYPQSSFYKQFPDFRYLCWLEEKLIGHMAVDHRLISVGESAFSIFGIIDICVHPAHQSKQIGSSLLDQVSDLAHQNGIDFLVLVANDADIFQRKGFKIVNNTCKWLLINRHQTLGVVKRKIDGALMIKPTSKKTWNEGTVDLLGCVF